VEKLVKWGVFAWSSGKKKSVCVHIPKYKFSSC
jgi:hypothetical protein